MARTRPKVSAKEWAEKPDSGFEPTTLLVAKELLFSPKKEGQYRLEIVPYQTPVKLPAAGTNPNASPGDYHYERTYFIHRGIGADENSYVCPKRTAGKPCPICEYIEKMARDKDADEDVIKEMMPKQRQLWNIVDHDNLEAGVQVWDISYHNFGKQLKKEIRNADEDDGYEYFADPDEGLTVKVFLESTSFGGGNAFLQASSISFKARKSPLSDEILDGAQILDNLIKVYDYDKLRKIFLQEPEELQRDPDDAPFDAEEPPKKETKQTINSKPEKKAEKKELTVDDIGVAKGDEVVYDGEVWTIVKVLGDGELVNLMNDDDDMKKNVEVNEIQKHSKITKPEPETKSEKKEEPKAEKKVEKKPEPTPEPEAEPSADSDWDDWE